MRTFVIGSSGFLGRHLNDWFCRLGPVIAAPSIGEYGENNEKWQNDVLLSMCQFEPDLVLMPGASQLSGDDPGSLISLVTANCIFPCLVAQRLLKELPKAQLVTFGTSWQYSDSDTYRPFNLYAASKQASLDLLAHYALKGLQILHLTLFDTYGEDDQRRKLLTILKDAVRTGHTIETTLGDQEIDLVHIQDVCKGVEKAVYELSEWDHAQGVLIRGLGSGKPISVKELMHRVSKFYGGTIKAKVGSLPYREREVMRVYKNYVRPRGWVCEHVEYQDKK